MLEHLPRRTAIEHDAAAWVLRAADGLSAEQEVELATWLAADLRHSRAFAEASRAWRRFEAAPTPDSGLLLRRPAAGRRGFRHVVPWLAAAAMLAFLLSLRSPLHESHLVARTSAGFLPGLCEQQTLPDGTTVALNRGAELVVDFAPEVRRVRLLRGEALFHVHRDPSRPFSVLAGAVEARALGTAFNVRMDSTAVEVLVTEGVVQVTPRAGPDASSTTAPDAVPGPVQLAVNDRAIVQPEGTVQVQALSAPERDRALVWRPFALEFDDAPLERIVTEFNARNPVRLVVNDPALAARRMTIAFRSDNVAGFVRLLEANYGIVAVPLTREVVELRRR